MDSNNNKSSVTARVRDIASTQSGIEASRLSQMSDTDSLYDAGMNSLTNVKLMLALESEFDIVFPNRLLTRTVFTSISSIASAVEQIS